MFRAEKCTSIHCGGKKNRPNPERVRSNEKKSFQQTDKAILKHGCKAEIDA